MNVLIVGQGGKVSGDLLALLGAPEFSGWTVHGVGRDELDLGRPDTIGSVLAGREFDALVNCAAFTNTSAAERNPDLAYAINGAAVRHLAQACRARLARLVHISTDYVFDGTAGRAYHESDAVAPINVYGASKLEGERHALEVLAKDAVVLRTASVFGARRGATRHGNFVKSILEASRSRPSLEVIDNIRMSPTSSETIARALIHTLRAGVTGGVYHVVDTGDASWFEFAEQILHEAGIDCPVNRRSEPWPDDPVRRPPNSALATARFAATGFEFRPWRETLGDYLAALRESGDGA